MNNLIKSKPKSINNRITYSFSGMLHRKNVVQLKTNCCSFLEMHGGSKTALLIAIILFTSLGTAFAVKMLTGSAFKAGIPIAIGLATSYGIFKNEEDRKKRSTLAALDFATLENK